MANKISDRQIELLTKIYNGTIKKDEARDYIFLLVTDNALGAESLPVVQIWPEDKMRDAYAMMLENQLCISQKAIKDIMTSRDDVAIVISSIGHELKHYRQRHINYSEFKEPSFAEYHKQVYNEMEHYDDDYGDYINALKMLQNPENQEFLKAYFDNHADEPFVKWFSNLIPEEKEDFANVMEEARYLGTMHETDARYAGVIFNTMMLERYIADSRVQSNSELCKWLQDLKSRSTKIFASDYADYLELASFYDEFNEALQNVSKEFVQDLAEQIVKCQNPQQKQVYDSLLYLAVHGYIKSIANSTRLEHLAKDQLAHVFKWALQHINDQNTNGSAKPERILACKFASEICFDTRIDTQTKNQFFNQLYDLYFAHAHYPKDQMNYQTKVHKFDELDTYLLHMTAYNSDNRQFKLMEELDNNERFAEICNFIDYKQLYIKELDGAETLPEHYLNNINQLLVGKCEMLIAIKPQFAGHKPKTKTEQKALDWYVSALSKAKEELTFCYCLQEDRAIPRTSQQRQRFVDYVEQYLNLDMGKFLQAQKDATELQKGTSSKQKERE